MNRFCLPTCCHRITSSRFCIKEVHIRSTSVSLISLNAARVAYTAFKWAVMAGQEFIIVPFNASDVKKLQRIKLASVKSLNLDSSCQVSFTDEEISKRTAKVTICYCEIEFLDSKQSGSTSPTRRGFFHSLSLPSSPLRKNKGILAIAATPAMTLCYFHQFVRLPPGNDFLEDDTLKEESFFVHEEGSKVDLRNFSNAPGKLCIKTTL